MADSKNNILNVFSDDDNQTVYTINPRAKFGVNPSQAVVSAISKAVNPERITNLRQSTVSGVFQSILSKYINSSVTSNYAQLSSFELQVDKDSNEFYISFNGGFHPEHGEDIRVDGYEVYGIIEDNSIQIQAQQIELVDAKSCFGPQVLPDFLESSFRGEFLSQATIICPESSDVKMGAATAIRNEEGVQVSAANFNVAEDMSGILEGSMSQDIVFKHKDFSGEAIVSKDEISAFHEAYSVANDMVKNQLAKTTTSAAEITPEA